MIRVYRDRDLCHRLSARAREEYTPIRWDLMKQRYLDLVNGLAGIGEPAGQPKLARVDQVSR